MYTLRVDGMTCGGCVRSLTHAVTTLDQTAKVEVDLASKRVQIESSAPLAALTAAIDEAGYTVLADDAS